MAKRKYSVVDRGTFYKSEAYKKAKMARQARYIRPAALVPELKSVDYDQTVGISSASPAILCLNIIGAGTDINQRVGRKVKLNSLQTDMTIVCEDGGTGRECRMALVYDRNPNGAMPIYSDIFADVAGTTNAWTGVNLKNRDRFKILRDHKQFLVGSSVSGVTEISLSYWGSTGCKSDYIKLGLDEVFGNGDDDIGAIQTGALYAVAFTQTGGTPSPAPSFHINSRVRYTDM